MQLTMTSGRLRLTLSIRWMGQDIQAELEGGEVHVGGTALAGPGMPVQIISLPGHRDAELAAQLAQGLAAGLSCAVSVTAGIHYPAITREEIAECRRMTEELLHKALECLARETGDRLPSA